MPDTNNIHKIFSRGIDPDLAAKIRQARKQRQLTQDELARKVGLRQSSIAKLESSRADIPTQRFLEICRVLGFELILVPKEKLAAIRSILKPQSSTEEYSEFRDLLGVKDEDGDSENEQSGS